MTYRYREFYNREMRTIDPSAFRSLEAFLQLSTNEMYHVSYDSDNGLRQHVIRLVDSKTRIEHCDPTGTLRRINRKSRRDLLRLLLEWGRCDGQVLDEEEMTRFLTDLGQVCHRYNNVIIHDSEIEMTFEELKDLSKRKLRIRSTGAPEAALPYYDPEELPAYEGRLSKDEDTLASSKQKLVDAIEDDRPDAVLTLSRKVADLMRLVDADRRRIEGLREAKRYIDGE